jgi:hypothetical protein
VKSDAYDPAALKRDYRAQRWGKRLSEKLLREF